MSSPNKPVLLLLGGAGAQNSVVAKTFAATGKYTVRVLTRSISHSSELDEIPNLKLIEGDCYDEKVLWNVLADAELVYVNTNGFAIGESKEIYWGIRMYEMARWAGVKHFVYAGLPYVTQNGGFDPKRRVPFVDGKGKVVQYLKSLPTEPMIWSVLSSGPYAERCYESGYPKKDKDGVHIFNLPLGPTGAMPLVSLDDLGKYAVWVIEHPERSAGLELGVAIAHVTGSEHAEAFERVTGKKARWNDVPLEAVLAAMPPEKVGGLASPGFEDPTNVTAAEHFGPWFGIFRDSGGNTGCWQRDYALLDEIMPDRIRSLEEWMRKVNYDGEPKAVLKNGVTGQYNANPEK